MFHRMVSVFPPFFLLILLVIAHAFYQIKLEDYTKAPEIALTKLSKTYFIQ